MKGLIKRTHISKSCIDHKHDYCYGIVWKLVKDGDVWLEHLDGYRTPTGYHLSSEKRPACECKCHDVLGAA